MMLTIDGQKCSTCDRAAPAQGAAWSEVTCAGAQQEDPKHLAPLMAASVSSLQIVGNRTEDMIFFQIQYVPLVYCGRRQEFCKYQNPSKETCSVIQRHMTIFASCLSR